MYKKIHLFDLDSPDGRDDFRCQAHSYLRMEGTVPKGPATFEWNQRQMADLEELWIDPDAEGARDRLARDLAGFADKLGWSFDPEELDDAEAHGDEYLLTVSSGAPELYVLPWEVIKVGSSDTYFADYDGSLVRYVVPGLMAREPASAPPNPGVLLAWSSAGGAVPNQEQGDAIRDACERTGVEFRELAEVSEASLHQALQDNPPSVLHLLCHGVPGPEGEPPRLSWGTIGDSSDVTATRLARILRRYKDAIRLVVLSACGSGDGQQDGLYMSSLAQELHKKGIPNVVASRYPLSVRGSKVMVRELYSKMLVEAWSLERSLRASRSVLFLPDKDGHSHPGDAYGMQLYSYGTERFISANGVEAQRPILASYPFGTAEQPVPLAAPPRKDVTIELEQAPERGDSRRLRGLLVRFSEDASLTHKVDRAGKVPKLLVDTTVDGAQRLLQAWRAESLTKALGMVIISVTVAKGLNPPKLLSMSFNAEQAARQVAQITSAAAATAATATATAGVAVAAGASRAKKALLGAGLAAAVTVAAVAAIIGLGESRNDAAADVSETPAVTASAPAGSEQPAVGSPRASEPAPGGAETDPGVGAGSAVDQPDLAAASAAQAAGGEAGDIDQVAEAAAAEAAAAEAGATGAAAAAEAGATGAAAAAEAGDNAAVADKGAAAGDTPASATPDAAGDMALASNDTERSAKPASAATPASASAKTNPAQPASGATRPAPARRKAPDARGNNKVAFVAPIRVNKTAGYSPRNSLIRVSWTTPPGTTEVLVVENRAGKITGAPRPGKRYRSGSSWPRGGKVRTFAPTKKSHDWKLEPGQELWMAFWAMDDQGRYSQVTPYYYPGWRP